MTVECPLQLVVDGLVKNGEMRRKKGPAGNLVDPDMDSLIEIGNPALPYLDGKGEYAAEAADLIKRIKEAKKRLKAFGRIGSLLSLNHHREHTA